MTGPRPAPSVAVVITNHNYGRYVLDAIDSVLAQTLPCDVIVVDDGSSDDSLRVLSAHARNPRIRLIAKENGGQASALNAGWAATDASVVLFLDGDDRLDPSAVEAVVERFATDPSAVRCQFRLRFVNGDGIRIPGGLPEPARLLPAGDLIAALTCNPDDIAWQPTSGNAFTASVLERIMPIPESPYRISADHYLSNLSPLYGPVVTVERELGDYRIHGRNADHRDRFDLERIRSILVRTHETRRHLVSHGRRLSLTGMPQSPEGFRSLTTAGLRLISYRLDPPTDGDRNADGGHEVAHPFAGDRLPGLVGRGFAAAWGRSDLAPSRRLLGLGWIAALAVAPRGLIPRIASKALTR